jgi:hypothetical protein
VPRPQSMARERLPLGALATPWLALDHCQPVAAPAEDVAARLGVPIAQVHAAGVEPYLD